MYPVSLGDTRPKQGLMTQVENGEGHGEDRITGKHTQAARTVRQFVGCAAQSRKQTNESQSQ
jgi:hypothetical protein